MEFQFLLGRLKTDRQGEEIGVSGIVSIPAR